MNSTFSDQNPTLVYQKDIVAKVIQDKLKLDPVLFLTLNNSHYYSKDNIKSDNLKNLLIRYKENKDNLSHYENTLFSNFVLSVNLTIGLNNKITLSLPKLVDILDNKLGLDSSKFFDKHIKKDKENNDFAYYTFKKTTPWFNSLKYINHPNKYNLDDKELALLHVLSCKLYKVSHSYFDLMSMYKDEKIDLGNDSDKFTTTELINDPFSKNIQKLINDFFDGKLEFGYLVGLILNPEIQLTYTKEITTDIAKCIVNYYHDDFIQLEMNGKLRDDVDYNVIKDLALQTSTINSVIAINKDKPAEDKPIRRIVTKVAKANHEYQNTDSPD